MTINSPYSFQPSNVDLANASSDDEASVECAKNSGDPREVLRNDAKKNRLDRPHGNDDWSGQSVFARKRW